MAIFNSYVSLPEGTCFHMAHDKAHIFLSFVAKYHDISYGYLIYQTISL